jgi:hypothetical protein
VGAGAASSLGIGIAWEARFRSLHCDNSPTERLVQSANQRTMSGVCYSTTPAPSASCLVARAAGKPSCWPMGIQARSGVGAAPLTLLATLQPNGFQKSTCNHVPASASPATGTAKHDMDTSRMHAASTSASAKVTQPTGQYLSGDCSNQHITFTRHSVYACHQPRLQAPESSLSTLPRAPASPLDGPPSSVGVCAVTVDAQAPHPLCDWRAW